MSDRLDELAARKQLLLARSSLHRLRLQHGTHTLRQAILSPRGMFSIASSRPVKALAFSALLAVAGRGRLGRWLRGAMAVLAIAKALRAGRTGRA